MKKAETATPLPVHKEVEFAEFSIKSPQICQIKWFKTLKFIFINIVLSNTQSLKSERIKLFLSFIDQGGANKPTEKWLDTRL